MVDDFLVGSDFFDPSDPVADLGKQLEALRKDVDSLRKALGGVTAGVERQQGRPLVKKPGRFLLGAGAFGAGVITGGVPGAVLMTGGSLLGGNSLNLDDPAFPKRDAAERVVSSRKREAFEKFKQSAPLFEGKDFSLSLLMLMKRLPEEWDAALNIMIDENQEFAVKVGEAAARILGEQRVISEGAEQMLRDYARVVEGFKAQNDEVRQSAEKLKDDLVGHSIIPDMVEDIGRWFGKLDGLMGTQSLGIADDVRKAFDGMGQGVAQSIGDMVKGAKLNFDSLRGLARSVVQDLQTTLVNKLVAGPIDKGIGILTNALFSGLKVPGFAGGGAINAGGPVLVGERGPELFVPDVSGVIRPNSHLKPSGPRGPIFNVDMKGASLEAVQRLELFVRQINGSIEMRAIAAVANDMARRP